MREGKLETRKLCLACSILAIAVLVGHDAAAASPVNFEAVVAVSDSPNYIKQWMSTPASSSVRIKKVAVFTPGEIAYCSILVSAVSAEATAGFDFSADIEFLNPDGSVLYSEPNYAHSKGLANSKLQWVMLDPALDLGFDETDPLGTYAMKVTVKDRASGAEVKAEEWITLTKSKSSKEKLTRPITSAGQLDGLWTLYFETGEDAAVRRIISVLHWLEDGQGMQIVIGGAAQWSLKSNAAQHPGVLAICKDELARADETTSSILKKIVAEAGQSADR